jgi:sugar O-acyltransferase (sialic acid O-acetyltransferase NeuD family)
MNKFSKKRLAIIGAGDLGKLISHHAINDNHYSVVGFFDDTFKKDEFVNEIKVLGGIKDVLEIYNSGFFDFIMIGIGYKHMQFRKKVFNDFFNDIPFGTIIHSSCYVDSSCEIGKGSFLLPGCILDKDVQIGENTLLNTGCIIAHDTTIKAHCFLSPGVNVAGKIIIEESCIIGINATIIDNITICPNVQIGGGAVVINNIFMPGLYVGLPAKFKK